MTDRGSEIAAAATSTIINRSRSVGYGSRPTAQLAGDRRMRGRHHDPAFPGRYESTLERVGFLREDEKSSGLSVAIGKRKAETENRRLSILRDRSACPTITRSQPGCPLRSHVRSHGVYIRTVVSYSTVSRPWLDMQSALHGAHTLDYQLPSCLNLPVADLHDPPISWSGPFCCLTARKKGKTKVKDG